MAAPSRTLIVNADDLGLHVDIDRGIERAHLEGIVTSASLAAVGASFEHAVELCRRCSDLDVGVHLTLVGERPLSDASTLGDLVTPDGRFVEAHPALVARALTGRIGREALFRELDAQIEKVVRAGIRPSHLDAHQHVHLLPGIWPVVVELSRRHDIRWVRVPAFRPLIANGSGPLQIGLRLGMNVLQWGRRAGLAGLRSADFTPALAESGRLTAQRIRRALERVPAGAVTELVAHPGVTTPELEARYDWGYDWSGETEALTDPTLRAELSESGFELRSFGDLAA